MNLIEALNRSVCNHLGSIWETSDDELESDVIGIAASVLEQALRNSEAYKNHTKQTPDENRFWGSINEFGDAVKTYAEKR